MKNIIVKPIAIGIATTLAATSLALNTQPAKAGEEFWGSVLGGFLGGIVGGGANEGGRREVSSKKVRKAAQKMLLHNGLTPIDECTVNAVLVSIGSEDICAMPNHIYAPGTYRVHPDTFALIPYGMTARSTNTTTYPPNNNTGYPTTYLPNNNTGYPTTYPPNNNTGYPTTYPPNNNTGYPTTYPPNNNTGYPTTPPVINIGNTNQASSPFGANSSIYRLSGQQISPPVLARLRSLLAGNNIAEAACGATAQQVIVTINNDFVICGHPNSQYAPGNYSFTLNGIH